MARRRAGKSYSEPDTLPLPGADVLNDETERLDVLKHEEPVAYLSKHLPRMDESRDAPTRPLNPFEKSALVKLQKGDDLQTETTTSQIHMLGSIRALNQCVTCHRVHRGDLLGAFSYTLCR
jgi:hypothetical protein